MDEERTSVNSSLVKTISFGAVVLFLALMVGYQLRLFGAETNARATIWLGSVILVWFSLNILSFYIIESKSIVLLLGFLQVGALFFLLPGDLGAPLRILAAGVLWLFLFLSYESGKRNLGNAVKIRFFSVGRTASSVLMVGVDIFLTLFVVIQIQGGGFSVPRPALQAFVRSTEPIMNRFVPGFSEEMSTLAFLESFTRTRLPEGTPAPAVTEIANNLITSIEEQLKTGLDPQKSVIDSLDDVLGAKLGEVSETRQSAAVLVLGVAVFFILMGIGFFIRYIGLILSFVLYQILIAVRFMRISLEDSRKEVIVV